MLFNYTCWCIQPAYHEGNSVIIQLIFKTVSGARPNVSHNVLVPMMVFFNLMGQELSYLTMAASIIWNLITEQHPSWTQGRGKKTCHRTLSLGQRYSREIQTHEHIRYRLKWRKILYRPICR